MRLEKITIGGTIEGTIWNGQTATKQFKVVIPKSNWINLREALKYILDDGDFQEAKIQMAFLEACHIVGNHKKMLSGGWINTQAKAIMDLCAQDME